MMIVESGARRHSHDCTLDVLASTESPDEQSTKYYYNIYLIKRGEESWCVFVGWWVGGCLRYVYRYTVCILFVYCPMVPSVLPSLFQS